MISRRSFAWLVSIALFSGATIAACAGGDSSTDPGSSDDANADGSGDGVGFDPDSPFGDKKVVKLTVDPDGKTIEILNGDLTSASISYTATATLSDGSTAAMPSCVWTVDRIEIGSFFGSTFKATGSAGGSAKVTCAAAGLKGSANVSVLLKDSVDTSSGLDDSDKTKLTSAAAGDPSITKLLYPYDATVFPRGLPSPELMWNFVAASDVYALRLEEPGMVFTSYFKASNPARALIPKDEWTKLQDTASPTSPLKMTLFRMAGGAGGTPFRSVSQSWTVAAANLQGTIYYWRINGGKVVRIKPGGVPEDFLKLGGGRTCIACHSVSHDGSTLAGASENAGTHPLDVFDAKSGSELYYSGKPSGFQALYPDGSLIAWGQSQPSGLLQLADAKSGASYEPSGLEAFAQAAHPAFSPNGKLFAFALRKDGSWVDFNNSDLAIAPFDLASKKFGAAKVIRPGGGRVMTYPSFSPDSEWLAYMDATQSTRPGLADLHMIKPDGTGDVLLAAASGAGIADVDKHMNFEPNFSPLLSGGYFWVVFVSSRQYGNRLTSTYDAFRDVCGSPSWDATPCRHKQLWVAAIDASPKPGVDPSHPAFWLPGQDTADQNMRGYWALDPCKKLGEGCEAGFECCDGACKAPDAGDAGSDATPAKKICVKPPPGVCKELGDKCEKSTDCCEHELGIECIGGVCGRKGPS